MQSFMRHIVADRAATDCTTKWVGAARRFVRQVDRAGWKIVRKILNCGAGFSTVHFSILCGTLAGTLIGLAALVLRG